jgi:hypothetical protein
MDVGVDCNNYRPVSFEEVKARLVDKPLTYHHPDMEKGEEEDDGSTAVIDYSHLSDGDGLRPGAPV